MFQTEKLPVFELDGIQKGLGGLHKGLGSGACWQEIYGRLFMASLGETVKLQHRRTAYEKMLEELKSSKKPHANLGIEYIEFILKQADLGNIEFVDDPL